MNLNFNRIDEIKEKFARLITYLYFDAKIELDNISEAMVSSSFLNIFEENRLNDFMNMRIEDMGDILFPNLYAPLQDSNKDIGEVYWSGLQYMNILMNYRIPLRTIFILLPLKEMVKKYNVYHEMNEIELCRDFMKYEYKDASILRYFRKKMSLSIREVSYLTNISESTIKYLENNEYFYNTTYKNLEQLSKVLNIDLNFFKRKSSFIPVTYYVLNSKDFMLELSKTIGDYYLKGNYPNISVKFYKEKDLDRGKAFLIVENNPFLLINGKETLIDDSVFLNILDKTFDRYLLNNLKDNLVI